MVDIARLTTRDADFTVKLDERLAWEQSTDSEVVATVTAILADVRKRGDAALLEYTARSLKAHGFTSILFIGDSGPNQAGMQEVSELLNQEWRNEPSRILFVSDWYTSAAAFISWLKERGETEESIGTHAGLYDTALLLAVAPEHVRLENMSVGQGMDIDGVFGDPTRASAEIGDVGLNIMHEAAMNQIRRLMAE